MLYNEVPVLLLTFNRPDITAVLLDKLREIKPKYLFIAQDGARNPSEEELTDKVKKCFEKIDWDCEIKTLIREKNLGCYQAVTGGIDRFFEQVEFGMILEDDCIPNQSFFELCAQVYNQEAELPRNIGLISGSNFETESKCGNLALLSEHTPLLRGRATWKKTWKLFNQHQRIKSDFIDGKLKIREKGWLRRRAMRSYMLAGYWDNDRYLTCYFNQIVAIVPDKNHISNLGFVGIHNSRPGAYHGLAYFDVDYSKGIGKLLISKQYNDSMLYFMKKMYIYGKIETLLKKIGLFSLAKKIVLATSRLFYSKKINTYHA